MPPFERRVAAADPAALQAEGVDLLQVNVGLRCNLACAHCHHAAGPTRAETMPPDVEAAVLRLARRLRPTRVDVTGGAPELHPRIGTMLEAFRGVAPEVQLRTNLSALALPEAEGLLERCARLGVRLVASLHALDPEDHDAARGRGSFAAAIAALRGLNAAGWGSDGGPGLDLATHPPDLGLAPGPAFAETFRSRLLEEHGVRFHDLLVLAGMPVGRWGDRLVAVRQRRELQRRLEGAFNPATLRHLACRRSLAVGWDGRLADCDFNLGAGLPVRGACQTVFDDPAPLPHRTLAFGPHCFACTAAEGSS